MVRREDEEVGGKRKRVLMGKPKAVTVRDGLGDSI
jgi:hypothetical protein